MIGDFKCNVINKFIKLIRSLEGNLGLNLATALVNCNDPPTNKMDGIKTQGCEHLKPIKSLTICHVQFLFT